MAAGSARARRGVARGEQLDAGQVLRREAEAQHLEQVAAAAAAHLEQAALAQVAPAARDEQPGDGALAFLRREQRRRVEPVVAPSSGARLA